MQPMMLLGLMALAFCTVCAQQAHDARCARLELADLVGWFILPSDTTNASVMIIGYPAWGSDARPDRKTWYSYGFPWLQQDSAGQVVHEVTPTEVKLKVNMLNYGMKEALLQYARRRYASQNPTLDDIKVMPLSRFTCTVTVAGYGDQVGTVKQFNSEPFSLDFAMAVDSDVRRVFLQRLNDQWPASLHFRCIVRSTVNNNTMICDNDLLLHTTDYNMD